MECRLRTSTRERLSSCTACRSAKPLCGYWRHQVQYAEQTSIQSFEATKSLEHLLSQIEHIVSVVQCLPPALVVLHLLQLAGSDLHAFGRVDVTLASLCTFWCALGGSWLCHLFVRQGKGPCGSK